MEGPKSQENGTSSSRSMAGNCSARIRFKQARATVSSAPGAGVSSRTPTGTRIAGVEYSFRRATHEQTATTSPQEEA